MRLLLALLKCQILIKGWMLKWSYADACVPSPLKGWNFMMQMLWITVNSRVFVQCQLLNPVRTEETTNPKIVISDVILRHNVLWNATSTCGLTVCERGTYATSLVTWECFFPLMKYVTDYSQFQGISWKLTQYVFFPL